MVTRTFRREHKPVWFEARGHIDANGRGTEVQMKKQVFRRRHFPLTDDFGPLSLHLAGMTDS
jgi:hypothetical protein